MACLMSPCWTSTVHPIRVIFLVSLFSICYGRPLISPVQGPHDATRWNFCERGIFQVEDVSLKPDHITRGTTAFFSIGAVSGSSTPVTAGKIGMKVSLAGLPVYMHEDDLCEHAHCPVEGGSSFQINYSRKYTTRDIYDAVERDIDGRRSPVLCRYHFSCELSGGGLSGTAESPSNVNL